MFVPLYMYYSLCVISSRCIPLRVWIVSFSMYVFSIMCPPPCVSLFMYVYLYKSSSVFVPLCICPPCICYPLCVSSSGYVFFCVCSPPYVLVCVYPLLCVSTSVCPPLCVFFFVFVPPRVCHCLYIFPSIYVFLVCVSYSGFVHFRIYILFHVYLSPCDYLILCVYSIYLTLYVYPILCIYSE